MSYIIEINGYICMSKEVFDDLMDNEINLNTFDFSSEDHGEKGTDVPVKVMLKDYFGDFDYVDGAMTISSECNLNGDVDLEDILESVASKLDENDMGYIEVVAEDRERWCYWLTKDMLKRGAWEKPEDPHWFMVKNIKPALDALGWFEYLCG